MTRSFVYQLFFVSHRSIANCDAAVSLDDFHCAAYSAGFLTRLQQLYQPMTEKLSAKPVAAVLYQSDLLSLADLQEVQNSPTPVKAAEHLLNRILNSCSAASYDCFLRALKAQNQEHIFLWLTYEGIATLIVI
jgi:hypothetical protein